MDFRQLENICNAYEYGYEVGLRVKAIDYIEYNKHPEGTPEHFCWMLGYNKAKNIVAPLITHIIQ